MKQPNFDELLADVLAIAFGTQSRDKVKPSKPDKLDCHPFVHPSDIKRILRMYVQGSPINDIAAYFTMEEKEVNDLIDRYVA